MAKIDAGATRVEYSTLLGGRNWDTITSLAVDAIGNAFVAGYTRSDDFPVTPGSLQTTPRREPGNEHIESYAEEGFVAKLNPAGSALVYSTYLGGKRADRIYGIAIDPFGRVYVTGYSMSTDFPGFQNISLPSPAFVTRIDAVGGSMDYSYAGFSQLGAWAGTAIALDAAGRVYITGLGPRIGGLNALQDPDPTPICSITQRGFFGSTFCTSQFIGVLDSNGEQPLFATELGYGGFGSGFGIALDAEGSIYTTGANLTVPRIRLPEVKPGTAYVAKIGMDKDGPRFRTDSIVNAASFLPAVDYGQLGTIFGRDLTLEPGLFSAEQTPLPRELGGISLLFDGQPVPLLAVSSSEGDQVNFQFPWFHDYERRFEASYRPGTFAIRRQDGIIGYAKRPLRLRNAPSLFSLPDGSGVVQKVSDGSLIGSENPARRGEVVTAYGNYIQDSIMSELYELLTTGIPTPASPLFSFIRSLQVKIGEAAAEVLFAGLAPGLVSVSQINFRVPENAPIGEVSLQVVNFDLRSNVVKFYVE